MAWKCFFVLDWVEWVILFVGVDNFFGIWFCLISKLTSDFFVDISWSQIHDLLMATTNMKLGWCTFTKGILLNCISNSLFLWCSESHTFVVSKWCIKCGWASCLSCYCLDHPQVVSFIWALRSYTITAIWKVLYFDARFGTSFHSRIWYACALHILLFQRMVLVLIIQFNRVVASMPTLLWVRIVICRKLSKWLSH